MQSTITPHGAPIRDAKLLPVQPPAHVIGRNRELASIHVTLKAGSAVFLSGAPGIGKTALAAVLAAAYIASNPGGVLWFNVLEDDVAQLIARIGRAYGEDTFILPEEDETAKVEKTVELLKKHRPLLVLDGMVDIDSTREFARLCASGIPMIVTNEMSGAGPWTPIELKTLSVEDSTTLLLTYAHAENHYPADVEALCKFIGGNPMAIELTGRLIREDDQTPAELLSALPSGKGTDGLQVMLAMMFKRLSAPAQGMLIVLSTMFAGSATAELMSDLTNAPASAVAPLMRQLIARGVVHERISYGQPAYTVHEAMQNYARQWLTNFQRLDSTEARALQSVLTYIERHAHNTQADHDRLAAEIDNILGAAAYAVEAEQAGAVQKIIQTIGSSSGNFVAERRFEPEMAILKKLAILLSPGEASKPVVPPVPAQAATPESEPEAAPAEIVVSSEGLLAELDQARAADDGKREARVLHALGKYYVDQGDTEQARSYYKQAIDAYSAAQDFDGAQSVLDAMLIVGSQDVDSEDTLLYIRRCIELADRVGHDPSQKGRLQTRQGDVQLAAGNIDAAIDSYKKAIESLSDSEDWATIGLAMSKLGDVYLIQHKYKDAIAILQQALEMFRKEHYPGFESKVLANIANAYTAQQDWSNGERYYQQALEIAQDHLDQIAEAYLSAAIAHIHELQGDRAGAGDYYARALHIAYILNIADQIATYAFELGRILAEDPRMVARAVQLLSESDQLVENTEAKRLLNRSNKRLERVTAAGIQLPPALESNREYVAAIYEKTAEMEES